MVKENLSTGAEVISDKESNEKSNVIVDWIYETGREVSEILGSGSSYYNIFKTKNEDEALKAAKESGRTYLIRKKKVEDRTIQQWYDAQSKTWFDD